MTERLMPNPRDLGRYFQSCIGEAILNYEEFDISESRGLRSVMGFLLPEWQRGIVWTEDQNVRLIESIWLGIPIGSYTFNRAYGTKYDNLLIDGQQRMNAIQKYLDGKLSVFGYTWDEVSVLDKRRFRNRSHFHCYITETTDEEYLKNYYNLMNFSGTPHNQSERA